MCQLQNVFQHDARMVGMQLIDEVKVQHHIHSPNCDFWETKVIIQRVR